MCNACGLFLKLHGRARPIELKSNIIRSRNRVKTVQNGTKRKTPYDAPATPGEIARQQQLQLQQQQQQQQLSPYEPHPRTLMSQSQNDDSHAQFTENVFDPQLSNSAQQNHHSSANLFADVNVTNAVDDDTQAPKSAPDQDQDLENTSSALRARVNELEIINDLYRSRITELESKQVQENATDISTLSESAAHAKIKRLEAELEALRRRFDTSQATAEPQTGHI